MYLKENILELYLKEFYPFYNFVKNKTVSNSGIRNRADFRCDELNLIIEFDGYRHYSITKVILSDQKKDFIYKNMGYEIIRIPYFVQISEEIIDNLFNIKMKWKQVYPHGFIDEKALLPADYCELGIKRFIMDLEIFSFIKDDIIKSLKNKIEGLGDKRLVLPESLFSIME